MDAPRPGKDEHRYESQPEQATRSDVVDSRELFRGKRELTISHEGQLYRLRVTRNGRLILNK